MPRHAHAQDAAAGRRRGLLTGAVAALGAAALAGAAVVAIGAPSAQAAPGSGYWHTSGAQILDSSGNAVRIAGINWYGFETPDEIVHGLWAQDYHTVIDTIRNLGYTTIRIPLSDEVVKTDPTPSNYTLYAGSGPVNQDLKGLTSLQILDKIVAYAGQDGLRIIIDNHRSEAGETAEANGLWYTSAYPTSQWLADWTKIATRYAGNPTVIGFDLRNEPHTPQGDTYAQGATWGTGDPNTDWRLAAEQAGNAVETADPGALVFVEGIGEFPNASGGIDSDWWGGNLEGVAKYPVVLNSPNHVVYSAHDYGPNLSAQPWFTASTTTASLQAVFDQHFGYVAKNNIAPLWIGEFGTGNGATDVSDPTPGSQGQWFQAMTGYLKANPSMDWTYWALNGEDSYALLDNSYSATPVSSAKQSVLAGLEFALSGGGTASSSSSSVSSSPSGPSSSSHSSSSPSTPPSSPSSSSSSSAPPPPAGLQALYKADGGSAATTNNIQPGLELTNGGSTAVPLSGVTIRYWFTSDGGASTFTTNCYYALVGCANVTEKVVALSTARTNADHYLEVGFTAAAGSIGPAGTTGDIQAAFNKTDWSNFNQANDYSFNGAASSYTASTHVTVYVNGTLVWGTEP